MNARARGTLFAVNVRPALATAKAAGTTNAAAVADLPPTRRVSEVDGPWPMGSSGLGFQGDGRSGPVAAPAIQGDPISAMTAEDPLP